MAEEVGMTLSAYRKIEKGITNTPTMRLMQIAEALEVNPGEFFQDNVAVAESMEKIGFATKDEVLEIAKAVQALTLEFKKFREELPVKKGKEYIKKQKRAKK